MVKLKGGKMALLSAANNGGASSTSSISQGDLNGLALFVIFILVCFGLVWLLVTIINLANEKKKYYQKLNEGREEKKNE